MRIMRGVSWTVGSMGEEAMSLGRTLYWVRRSMPTGKTASERERLNSGVLLSSRTRTYNVQRGYEERPCRKRFQHCRQPHLINICS